ncbi:uncharacterized protein YdcH (DUF465 family) [Flavobacterium sp. PL11]|uniref:hypothetical protein n=1 Tax=Flavobacterium sp. PL11 TaxID=3071717 RepID=UPI002E070D9D|nr:uncharacterized protein YdcH (DUF465 family) [Flavobacterium sp. PL11]
MKTKEIYISLKEAENLIFSRCLILSKNRLDVKRAQGLLSVNITIEEDKLLDFESNNIVLFSAVQSFEIPDKELNLFINHYRVPMGLLKLNSRKIRDTSDSKEVFNERNTDYNPQKYLRLRNGLTGICNLGYSKIANLELVNTGEKILNEFTSLSDFRKKMLLQLTNETKFPLLTVKVDKFVTDTFFRITWWGKFSIDNYVNQLGNSNAEEVELIKKWFRGFLQFDDLKHTNQLLSQIPEALNDEIDFILGYYFAAVYSESFQAESDFLDKLNTEIKFIRQDNLNYWISFFKSLFDEKMGYLYFVKSIDKELFKIEKLALELTSSDFENSQKVDFKFIKVDDQELLSAFLSLREGGDNHNPLVIKNEDANTIFNNNLSPTNIKKIGFEYNSQYDVEDNLLNVCWFSKLRFHLNLNSAVKSSELMFYIKDDSAAKERLSELKIKVKPFSKLVDKNKKILVGFIEMNSYPSLLKIYTSFFKIENKNKMEKAVFILNVDLLPDEIQSLKFNDFRKDKVKALRTMLNVDIDLIVKNKNNGSDIEIKRNLKNSLKNYKMAQIEVIGENFDNSKAIWLLESNTEYFIQNKNENYYSFLNVE